MNTAQSMTDTVRPIRRSRGVKEIKEENEGEIIRVNRYYRRGGINRSLRNIYVSSSRGSCVWSIDQQISFIFSFFNGYHIQQHTHTHTKEAHKILLTIRIFYLQIKFHNTILIIDLALVLFSVVFVCERKREREREKKRPVATPVASAIRASSATPGYRGHPALPGFLRSPLLSKPPQLPPVTAVIQSSPATSGLRWNHRVLPLPQSLLSQSTPEATWLLATSTDFCRFHFHSSNQQPLITINFSFFFIKENNIYEYIWQI